MKKILLLSDTHGYMDDAILRHVKEADEVWHAGDIGNIEVADRISRLKPLTAVYGNIDDHQVRITYPEFCCFTCEGLKILMTHIAGNPGKYNPSTKNYIRQYNPGLIICGHSHILKVIRDPATRLLHMNPGAAGVHGFHQQRTMLRFKIQEGQLKDLEVIDMGKRGSLA